MSWLVYLVAIPVFAVIVLIHEFGHFITAKWAGIRVEEFGIGFPPRAFGIKRGETIYSINWLPIGGFVRMPGENGETTDAEGQPDPGSFSSKPAYKRIIVLLAGVTMNMLLAIVLLGGADAIGQVIDFQPVVGTVVAHSPAAQAGLQTGDTIIAVNGKTVKTWTAMTNDISAVTDSTPKATTTVPVTLVVVHTGQTTPETLKVDVRAHPVNGEGHLGISVNYAHAITTRIPFWQIPQDGVKQVGAVIVSIGSAFQQIFQGKLAFSQAFTGPVGIVNYTGEAASVVPQVGLYPILFLTGALSVSLAVMNVLPFPALDGGRVLLVLIEIVRRGKRLSPEREGLINLAGMAVLLSFIMVITFFDVSRIFGGH